MQSRTTNVPAAMFSSTMCKGIPPHSTQSLTGAVKEHNPIWSSRLATRPLTADWTRLSLRAAAEKLRAHQDCRDDFQYARPCFPQ